ncbi:MAG: hypothetical protein WAK48_16140 [Candidatus Acidiferrum sp.]|jgi:hypothetical protein
MSQSPLISAPRNSVTTASRRSTRIEKSVPLIVLGQNRTGEPFMERTVSLCLNMHGCRYPSRHDYGVGTWVTLQVVELMKDKPSTVRAMVRSVHPPASLRELPQVGVELETPGNVWGIAAPPADWLSAQETNPSTDQLAAVHVPAQESPRTNEGLGEIQIKLEPKMTEVASLPSPSPVAARPPAPKVSEAPQPQRVVVTPDGLIAALQGKLQQEAVKAVQAVVAKQVHDVIREALRSIDDARRSSVQEVQALVQSAVNSGLEEFRREADRYVNMALAETKERAVSALSALDADSRATCDARRQTLETEVARSAERATEQFRKGMKTCLDSFLEATVGALDEHSGHLKDDGKTLHEARSK